MGHVAAACTPPPETEHGRVALEFAHVLIAGKFQDAHTRLSSPLRAKVSAAELESKYKIMMYEKGPPVFVQVMNTLESWPAKQNGDIGWAYVSISGAGYAEGIAVVVAREGERLVVRDIEWGRP